MIYPFQLLSVQVVNSDILEQDIPQLLPDVLGAGCAGRPHCL